FVPCDLCDHSQISQVVNNDVRNDILFTTVHVTTDCLISDHMNQDLTQRSRTAICVPLCPRERAPAMDAEGCLETSPLIGSAPIQLFTGMRRTKLTKEVN
ncbi:unnamed protein product, partial [Staurois parvus]